MSTIDDVAIGKSETQAEEAVRDDRIRGASPAWAYIGVGVVAQCVFVGIVVCTLHRPQAVIAARSTRVDEALTDYKDWRLLGSITDESGALLRNLGLDGEAVSRAMVETKLGSPTQVTWGLVGAQVIRYYFFDANSRNSRLLTLYFEGDALNWDRTVFETVGDSVDRGREGTPAAEPWG